MRSYREGRASLPELGVDLPHVVENLIEFFGFVSTPRSDKMIEVVMDCALSLGHAHPLLEQFDDCAIDADLLLPSFGPDSLYVWGALATMTRCTTRRCRSAASWRRSSRPFTAARSRRTTGPSRRK